MKDDFDIGKTPLGTVLDIPEWKKYPNPRDGKYRIYKGKLEIRGSFTTGTSVSSSHTIPLLGLKDE